jgi:hypothetical protein
MQANLRRDRIKRGKLPGWREGSKKRNESKVDPPIYFQ